MQQSSSEYERTIGRRHALCVGIGTYTKLDNRNLRFASADAIAIAERLADAQRGNFDVTLLTEPAQTTKVALDEAVEKLLSAPDRQAEDLALLYFSCHGDLNKADNSFCLLPSDATLQSDVVSEQTSDTALQSDVAFEQTTVIGISDLATWFSKARTRNIVLLLDVCHSGGAGIALQHFNPHLELGPNYFIFGAARQDQIAEQSSRLEHGIFTYCFLRASEQPPTKDGWLTISQIQNFIGEEMTWFAKDRPVQIQTSSMAVNSNLPLLRNPGYPELCPRPPFWNVPFPRNRFFTEQNNLLSQLANMLNSEQKMALTQPTALSGLGGIGKTQLALEYAYRHRQDYHAVLWGRADTRENLIASFVAIASLLDLPEKDEKDQMVIVEAVKVWLADRTTWLLVLDNADELAVAREFIPPAFRGHLLLTTRAQTMGRLAGKLEMGVMQSEIGAMFLLHRSGLLALEDSLEKASSLEVRVAKELVQDLGGLPLALDQAGAYIDEMRCGLTAYQELYRTRRADMLKARGGLIDDHPESVATTWDISFHTVEQRNPAAADLLRLCAFLAPEAIPEEIFTKSADELGPILAPVVADPLRFNAAIAALGAYSLITRDPKVHTLTVHRLVQAFMRDSMAFRPHKPGLLRFFQRDTMKTQQQWMQLAVVAVNAAFPYFTFADWSAQERLLPHVLTCVFWIEQASLVKPSTVVLLTQAGHYLNERGRYAEAERLSRLALQLSELLLGAKHPQTAISLNNLGLLYMNQGKYAEAEPLFLRAFSILERLLGAEHPQTLSCLHNLVVLYITQGKYREAEPLARRTLSIFEQQLGAEHPQTAMSMSNLAALYYQQGKRIEAEPLARRALAIFEQQLGTEHPQTIALLSTLIKIYEKQWMYTEAETLSRRELAISEQQLGTTHPNTARGLQDLAIIYFHQKKYAETEQLLKQALSIFEQQLGAGHPDTATCLNNLAELYQAQEKYKEAEPLYERGLAIFKHQFGIEHPQTATILSNLASLYQKQERYAEAEPLYLQVLQIHEHLYGEDHSNTMQSLDRLADFYYCQGKYAEADPLLVRAMQILERDLGPHNPDTVANIRLLAYLYRRKYGEEEPLYEPELAIYIQQGPDHPDTATCLNHLSNLYQMQEKYAEAEPLARRVLSIRERYSGNEHPDTSIGLSNLAYLYQLQGKYAEAEPLFLRSLSIREQYSGTEHPDTAISVSNLAYLYQLQKKYAEAESLFLRTLTIDEKVYGVSHLEVVTDLNNLAILYENQKRYAEAELLYQRVLVIQEQEAGNTHPDIVTTLSNLASLYLAQEKYGEAESVLLRVLTIQKEQLEADHPDIAISLNNLADLYRSQGRYEEAEPLYQRALIIQEQQVGTSHPTTAISLNNLAVLYFHQGRYREAEPLYQRALIINEQHLGSSHLTTAISLHNLAKLYRSQGRYEEAEPLSLRALAILEEQMGASHLDTALSSNELALLYESQGRYEEAETMYRRTLLIYEQNLGRAHIKTQTIQDAYFTFLRTIGRDADAMQIEEEH